MKNQLSIFLTIILLSLINFAEAQTSIGFNGTSFQNKSDAPLYGKDIVIHDSLAQNQRNVSVCSAFNGWLYAIYSYNNQDIPYCEILKSVDQGITWEVLLNANFGSEHQIITKLQIIVCGNTVSTLKLFVAEAFRDTTDILSHTGGVYVIRYNTEPFGFGAIILSDFTSWYKDIAMASDQACPSTNSNPFNLGVLYSKLHGIDSLIFCFSVDGGISFSNRRVIATGHNFEKVALSYGRSASHGEGRYFAAWEKKDSPNATTGHIYTSHSSTSLNSSFTSPVCLDSLNTSYINNVRNPAISTQATTFDNDSLNLTEIVLFENLRTGNHTFDVHGFYNLQATTKNYFRPLTPNSSTDYNIQPDLTFNPYDSTFLFTYFDSTEKRLPLQLHNLNMILPNSWTNISTHYNDSQDIVAPKPKVALDLAQHKGINVWIKGLYGSNGVALFDAQNSTWTDIRENHSMDKNRFIKLFPNPCKEEIRIGFVLYKEEEVTIKISSIMGQPLGTVTDQFYSAGAHEIRFDVSKFSKGTYFLSLESSSGINETDKFFIIY